MAIYHCSTKPISRSSGRSAVAASAYRTGTRLHNDRDGQTHNYLGRKGIVHSEIVVARGAGAEWAYDRPALWNAVEGSEKRKDARVAREFELALPHELDDDQRLELTRAFSQELADRYGTAIDFAIHRPDPFGSTKNHHAHVMMTTRAVTADGLGDKTIFERENKQLLRDNLPTTQLQLKDVRRLWERLANDALASAGFDDRIDHRSHKDRGLEIEPTQHVGVHATAMQRQGIASDRARMDADTAKSNAEIIREKPEQVLEILAGSQSVFTKQDIARALHRYINDDAEDFQNAFTKVMSSPELVRLRSDKDDGNERFTTAGMFKIERDFAQAVDRLAAAKSHTVNERFVIEAMRRKDAALRASVSKSTAEKVARGELTEAERHTQIAAARLSDEQRRAIELVTGTERIAAVVGIAGAGKSTMLEAAREAWEAQGYRVHGAALSGKATDGLRKSSGIESRTLAAWQYRWERDKDQIGRNDVFVIDEAGMVGTRQLARFVQEVEARGAKIVLVGDHEQLQSIEAGAAFRAVTERAGFAELTEVRRQREGWQAKATLAFSQQQTADALRAYHEQGCVIMQESRADARGQLAADYLADRAARPNSSRVILAHERADVAALNAEIRAALHDRGELAQGEEAGERILQTTEGKRAFAAGDRIVFLENNDKLGVQNGTLGMVERIEDGRLIAVLDNAGRVEIPTDQYRAFDHGYATTIHKSQGDTVDRAFVLATAGMDRHLTYVAMSRHREQAQLYAAREDFERGGGRLVEHGRAPFENNPDNRDSYFVTLADKAGRRHTIWGVDLERVMNDRAKPVAVGDHIALDHVGKQDVTLPDGTKTHRNAWELIDPAELAWRRLVDQLGRDGSKETTLDYEAIEREDREQKGADMADRPIIQPGTDNVERVVDDFYEQKDAEAAQEYQQRNEAALDKHSAELRSAAEAGVASLAAHENAVRASTDVAHADKVAAGDRVGQQDSRQQTPEPRPAGENREAKPFDRAAAYAAVKQSPDAPMSTDEKKRAFADAKAQVAAEKQERGRIGFGKIRDSAERPADDAGKRAERAEQQRGHTSRPDFDWEP